MKGRVLFESDASRFFLGDFLGLLLFKLGQHTLGADNIGVLFGVVKSKVIQILTQGLEARFQFRAGRQILVAQQHRFIASNLLAQSLLAIFRLL